MMRGKLLRSLCLAFSAALFCAGPATGQGSVGTEFWLAFEQNLDPPNLSLFITGQVSTAGTVEIPGLAFSTPFTVTPGTVTTVPLPAAAQITSSDTIETLGIRVLANDPVAVYGLSQSPATTDAYLGLPVSRLGSEHIALAFENWNVINGSQFAIVAATDGTTVTITPTLTTDGHGAGMPYDVMLDRGEVYQLVNTDPSPADLTGSLISSSAPVAVFGGHLCAQVPSTFFTCDHIVEQLPTTDAWGRAFVTLPLATRLLGDTFRFVAALDNTEVFVNGVLVATLDRGGFHEQIIDGPAEIRATERILVAQYSNGSSFDGVISDPFVMLIPPFEQFLAAYTVTTPASGFDSHFINVVTDPSGIGSLSLDGVPVDAGDFVPIAASGFVGAQLSIAPGSHNLNSTVPFGAFIYGFADADSYGYPGGQALGPVGLVVALQLAPKFANRIVGTVHCVIATVSDDADNPLPDVRVDFSRTGVNPGTGFAFTQVDGTAEHCYVGMNEGEDAILATVGVLSDDATVVWTVRPIPTLSRAALMVLLLTLGAAGTSVLRRHNRAS